MKTYVVEADGIPLMAYRAEGDKSARRWPGLRSRFFKDKGKLTVRAATIPEQAIWRAHSVEMQELFESDYNGDEDVWYACEGDGGCDPDSFSVLLADVFPPK